MRVFGAAAAVVVAAGFFVEEFFCALAGEASAQAMTIVRIANGAHRDRVGKPLSPDMRPPGAGGPNQTRATPRSLTAQRECEIVLCRNLDVVLVDLGGRSAAVRSAGEHDALGLVLAVDPAPLDAHHHVRDRRVE